MKLHLATSPEPLRERSTVRALCGEEITHAVFVINADGNVSKVQQCMEEFLSTLTCCPKCRQSEITERYLYGVVREEERKESAA